MTAAALAVAIGALVQGLTGFAFALIAAPVLLSATSPEQSVTGLAVLSFIVIAPTLGVRPQVLRREVAGLVAAAVPGMVVGAVVLAHAPEFALRVLLALGVLVAIALRVRHGSGVAPSSTPAAGFTAGALTTTIGVNGPPMVIHLLRRGATPRQLRGTLAATFGLLDIGAVGVLALAGSLRFPPWFGLLALAAAGGAGAGRALAGRLDGDAFEWVVLGLLVASAAVAIIAP